MNKPTCCVKCSTSPDILPIVKKELERIGTHGCWLDNCECHTTNTIPNEDSWEKEFDEKFPLRYPHEPKSLMISCTEHNAPASPAEMKDFIRETRTAAREAALREALEVVNLHKEANTENMMIGLNATLEVNQALEEVSTAITTLLGKEQV